MIQYYTTPLEDWITEFYQKLGIKTPYDFEMIDIASKLDIWLYFQPMSSRVIERNGMFSMNIDKDLSPEEKWEEFLHELCHVLRHTGNQFMLSDAFMELQEIQANQFQLYAAIPFFMLKRYELPNTEKELIELITSEFKVTPKLAKRRIDQIKRRALKIKIDEEFGFNIREQFKNLVCHPYWL